jgi:hypothetical protein
VSEADALRAHSLDHPPSETRAVKRGAKAGSTIEAGSPLKRLAAVLAVLFLLTQGLFAAPAMAQPAFDAPRLRLEVTQMTPRFLTGQSSSLHVSGKITNTGDRRITKIDVRLQLGERPTTDRQFTDALAKPPTTLTSQSRPVPVVDSLDPGQSSPLAITVPLGATASSLQVAKPGVYPLLVNVNGTPEFGGAARLAAVNMLLPVLSVPGKPPPERPAKPTGVSVLWPIANTVPRVATMSLRGPLVLTDNRLAAELGPGGRLYSLLSAAQMARNSSPRVFDSMCFALDPDLVQTVDAMSRGYQVRTSTGTTEGSGAETAKQWIDGLRQLVAGHCVVALPYADADLNVLAKVSSGGEPDTNLVTTAAGGAAVLQQVLGVQPQKGVLWPDGVPDTKTLAMLPGAGVETLLTDSARLKGSSPVTTTVSIAGTNLRAHPLDSLVASALTGTPAAEPTAGNVTTVAGQPEVATQNGLAALAFRALGQQASASQSLPGQLVVAPPRRWNAPLNELSTLVKSLSDYTNAGVIAPVALPQLLAEPAADQAAMKDDTQDLRAGPSVELSNAMSTIDTSTAGLVSGMAVDATSLVKPAQLVEPVRIGLVRAASTAWREANASTPAATFNARQELNSLSGRVTVAAPPQTINLASGTSPLPVFVSNTLPVAMTVRIKLTNNTSLRPEDIQDRVIPANGATNQYIPVEALRAGRFSVDVSLSTPAGTGLGTTARFQLTSNDYGTITILGTVAAAGALLLLSSRRIYRRIKESKAQRA